MTSTTRVTPAPPPVTSPPVTSPPVTSRSVEPRPDPIHPGGSDRPGAGPGRTPGRDPSRRGSVVRRLTGRSVPLAWLLLSGGLALAAHALAAARPGAPVATLGEARLAAAAVAVRGSELTVGALPLGDRFGALQLAVLQMLLPLGGVSVVDAARWACLLAGAAAALLIWPVLRGLGVSPPAAAVGVVLLGASVPAVVVHSGISAAAPAAAWLTVAAALAVRQWGPAALVAAVLAAGTAPLAAAALLALAAHLVLGSTVRLGRARLPLGVALGIGAVVVAGLAVGSGPLAGVAGPDPMETVAVVAVGVGAVVLALAWRVAVWLRPVLTAAAVLLLACLVPGPSRTTAALLVAPALAVAAGVLAEQLGERSGGRAPATLVAAVLVVLLAAPAPAVLLARPPAPAGDRALVSWLTTEPASDTVVRADDLDRAELLAADFPAARLRAPGDPVVPGELWLVADRPTGGLPATPPCPEGTVVAGAARATGGAPATVCRTDGGAPVVTAEAPRRTRLGSALADNPALTLTTAAAGALRAGEVDPRLMLVLAAMATAHRVAVDDFPVDELDDPALPRRRAVLSAVDGGPPATSELLANWLAAQQPPFVPSLVQPAGPALLVGYPAPPPSGLLPE